MPSKQYRAYCFTLNNPTHDETQFIEHIQLDDTLRSIVVSQERGEEETPHWQGYAEFNRPITLKRLKEIIGTDRLHAEPRKGTAEQAFKYCLKGKQSKQEWQTDNWKGPNFGLELDLIIQLGEVDRECGKRTDLQTAYEIITTTHSWREIINNPELHKVRAMYPQWVKETFDHRPILKMELSLLDWQKELLERLQQEPDNRTIEWVYDPKGSAGKSTFTQYLIRNHDAITVSGKAENMFAAYDNQIIVIVDIPRSTQNEYINYGAIEKLKDGVFFVGKYNSHMHVRPFNAHVVVFSNHLPEDGKFTSDRIRLTKLSEEEDEMVPNTSLYDQFRNTF